MTRRRLTTISTPVSANLSADFQHSLGTELHRYVTYFRRGSFEDMIRLAARPPDGWKGCAFPPSLIDL